MKITKEQKQEMQQLLERLQRRIEVAYGCADSSNNSWTLTEMMMNVAKIEQGIKELDITYQEKTMDKGTTIHVFGTFEVAGDLGRYTKKNSRSKTIRRTVRHSRTR